MSALPRFSDIDLLGYGERVINLDSEIADRALDLRVAQQELNRPKISRFLIDQRCLRPTQRMGAKQLRVKSDACHPFRKKPSILASRHELAVRPSVVNRNSPGLLPAALR